MSGTHQLGISAIMLFGSRARGDNSSGSDTDLLLVGPPGAPRHKSIGHLSMFFYPWEKLASDARDGDLFVCHIVQEAKVVFDPSGQLEKLRALFRLRKSYSLEIERACDLGWFIDRHVNALASQATLRRMVWCIRTILIAQLAERGTPVFAPAALAAAAPPEAADIIVNRHQRGLDMNIRRRFRHFLIAQCGKAPLSSDATIDDYRDFFAETGNMVGLRTIEHSMRKPEEGDDYYR